MGSLLGPAVIVMSAAVPTTWKEIGEDFFNPLLTSCDGTVTMHSLPVRRFLPVRVSGIASYRVYKRRICK